MALSGFYKVTFSSQLPGAGGIVVVTGNRVLGGDSQYLYSGSISEASDGVVAADIVVKAFASDARSVFGTSGGKFSLSLKGKATTAGFTLDGPSPFGGTGITISGAKVGELDLS